MIRYPFVIGSCTSSSSVHKTAVDFLARIVTMAAQTMMASTSTASSIRLSSKASLTTRTAAFAPLSSPIRRRQAFTVRAQEKAQVVQPINGDPFIGMLETPVTSAPIVANFLSSLPAYRTGVSPLLRGVEVGLVHGLLITGVWPMLQVSVTLSRGSNVTSSSSAPSETFQDTPRRPDACQQLGS